MITNRLRTGLSLVELLVVLLLISVLLAFGLPLTTQWYAGQISWVMQKDIEQAIEYGLQQSHILGEPLRLVPWRDQDWSTGLSLYRERDLLHPQNSALYTWQWHSPLWHVTWHGFVADSYLRFPPDLNQLALNGYFLIENRAQHRVKIIVNRVGRVREPNVNSP